MGNQMAQKASRNAGKCALCGDEIESTYRHDFKQCSCGNLFVDGGYDYQRFGYDSKREKGESALWSNTEHKWVTITEMTQATMDALQEEAKIKNRKRKIMFM